MRFAQLHLTLALLLGAVGLLARVEAQEQTATPVAEVEAPAEATASPDEPGGMFLRLSWQPVTGSMLAVTAFNDIRLYTPDLQLLGKLQGHSGQVRDLDWNPDGKVLASAGLDDTVRLWDVEARRMIGTIDQLSGEALYIRWSSDGQRLAVVASDRARDAEVTDCCTFDGYFQVSVWNVSNPAKPFLERNLAVTDKDQRDIFTGIRGVAWTLDDSHLILSNNISHVESALSIWNALTGEFEQKRVYGQGGFIPIADFARRPTSNVLAIGTWNGSAGLYNFNNDQHLMYFVDHAGATLSIDWDSRGRHVVTGDINFNIRIWDTATAKTLMTFATHGEVYDVDWSPDDRRVASIIKFSSIQIWDVSHLPDVSDVPTATYIPVRNGSGTQMPSTDPSLTGAG